MSRVKIPAHVAPAFASRLKIALLIASSVTVVELVGGLLSNSLALVGDAGHVFADVLAIALGLAAMKIAGRPHTPALTYGYHRAEILAALVNSFTLIAVSAFIFYEAYRRLLQPPKVETPLLVSVALFGLVANFGMILLLRKLKEQNLNIRGVFLHVVGDTVSSIGVVVGGVIVALTSYFVVDPLVGALIGVLILRSAIRLLRDSMRVLLEAVPRHMHLPTIAQAIREVEGVKHVHDLHVWTITSGMYALSGHIVVGDQNIREASRIVKSIDEKLRQRFNIGHSTIQLEPEEITEIQKQV